MDRWSEACKKGGPIGGAVVLCDLAAARAFSGREEGLLNMCGLWSSHSAFSSVLS